jgi:ketosteroid isomerase-like protein
MTTRATVEAYFERLQNRGEWSSCFADDVVFTSLTSPNKTITGKMAFLRGTQRFYSSIGSMQLRDLLVDDNRVCAFTRYTIVPPTGTPSFQSDVAELFTVQDGRITALTICFDTAPYPK